LRLVLFSIRGIRLKDARKNKTLCYTFHFACIGNKGAGNFRLMTSK
jgi:hypothetical protein